MAHLNAKRSKQGPEIPSFFFFGVRPQRYGCLIVNVVDQLIQRLPCPLDTVLLGT